MESALIGRLAGCLVLVAAGWSLAACVANPPQLPTPALTVFAQVSPHEAVTPEAATDTAQPPTGAPSPTSRPLTKTAVPATDAPEPTVTPAPPTNTAAPTQPSLATSTPPPATATPATGDQTGAVVAVIDGDTIDVNINGAVYRVRYIGINTPETGETCGSDATAANANLVSGQTVTLVKDVSETDRYGRLLRYVYVGSLFVNAELVSQGYAEAVEYVPDVRFADYFESLEAQARAANLNCYGTGVFGGFIMPTATAATVANQPVPTQAGTCDPSYLDVCIPPYPPDLDCGDIPYRRFRVLPPDPHGFDRDNDGTGCES